MIKARFVPRDDITTYELAIVVQKMRGVSPAAWFDDEQWDALDARIKRHFEPETFEPFEPSKIWENWRPFRPEAEEAQGAAA